MKRVKVRNEKARWSRDGQELTVTPRKPLRKGHDFALTVRYAGIPVDFRDVTYGLPVGFTPTSDGAIAVGQPESAATWFPVNDHPIDKASYDFAVRCPTATASWRTGSRGAASPASPVGLSGGGRPSAPMASYLATIDIGNWDVHRWKAGGAPGLRRHRSGDHRRAAGRDRIVAGQAGRDHQTFLSDALGRPYPFDTVGGIVDPERPIAFALETQTRPVYAAIFWTDRSGQPTNADYVVAHELAHQWFGDDIALGRWAGIWLNEGFATYVE